MRKEFKLTDEQFNKIIEISKPVSYMVFNGVAPESPQERANRLWRDLGNKLGFKYLTVQPVPSKGNKFFTAETI